MWNLLKTFETCILELCYFPFNTQLIFYFIFYFTIAYDATRGEPVPETVGKSSFYAIYWGKR